MYPEGLPTCGWRQFNNLRDYLTNSVNLDGRDVCDHGFPVHPDPYLDVVMSANGASIAGTVVDGNGRPIAKRNNCGRSQRRAPNALGSLPRMSAAISACVA